ncbi:GNAT family N-acetyltransferase [Roseitalea porphyridii]|uniref:GNAT family N-acetyltransferase n=1 Tax=Roseitalea porphyridii TaxID=1852022 RepID=A0A4P6V036_9HYPH|nr:GNAT family N-acetyltransferase [Roseitalea porphyridii]
MPLCDHASSSPRVRGTAPPGAVDVGRQTVHPRACGERPSGRGPWCAGNADELGRVEELWRALHRHHRSINPDLGPFVSDDLSWEQRRKAYDRAIATGGRVLVAERGGEVLGYVAMRPRRMAWPATFDAEAQWVDILTLVVRADMRKAGLCNRLMAAVDDFSSEIGVNAQHVGHVAGDDRAAVFYACHGFQPAWMTLLRLGAPIPSLVGADVPIETADPVEVLGVRELWLPVHRHHQVVSPELGPFVDDDTSWGVFLPIFEAAARRGLLLRAGPAAAPLGIAVLDIAVGRDDFADTWPTGNAVAEIDVMAVRADARGRGIGKALLAAAGRLLEARGVSDCCVGAIAGNAGAIRLFSSAGFRPAWAEMVRWTPGSRLKSSGMPQARTW